MFCSECGNKIEEGSRFCGGCGSKAATEVVHTKKSNTPRKKIGVVIGIVAAVILILIIIFAVLQINTNIEHPLVGAWSGGNNSTSAIVFSDNGKGSVIFSNRVESFSWTAQGEYSGTIEIIIDGTKHIHDFTIDERPPLYILRLNGYIQGSFNRAIPQ